MYSCGRSMSKDVEYTVMYRGSRSQRTDCSLHFLCTWLLARFLWCINCCWTQSTQLFSDGTASSNKQPELLWGQTAEWRGASNSSLCFSAPLLLISDGRIKAGEEVWTKTGGKAKEWRDTCKHAAEQNRLIMVITVLQTTFVSHVLVFPCFKMVLGPFELKLVKH